MKMRMVQRGPQKIEWETKAAVHVDDGKGHQCGQTQEPQGRHAHEEANFQSISTGGWHSFSWMNIYTINPVKFISRTSLITWWYIIKFRVYFKQKETRIIHRLKLSFNFYGWLTSILWNSFPEQAFNNIMIIKFRVYFWTKGNKNHG